MNKDMITQRLTPLIDENVLEFLKERGGWIAGGALTSVCANSEINDIDIYLTTREDIYDFIIKFKKVVHYSDKSVTFSVGGFIRPGVSLPHHQLITLQPYKTAQEIFDCFDFTINMLAWNPKTDEFCMHGDAMLHIAQRYLSFNESTMFPFMSLVRVKKYEDRGYKISKPQLMKIAFACTKKEVHTWDDVEKQLGGLYGNEVDLEEYKEKEYTYENLMEFLTNTTKVYKFLEQAMFMEIDEDKELIAMMQSGLPYKCWLSTSKETLFVEVSEGDIVPYSKNDLDSYGNVQVTCTPQDFILQAETFKEYFGSHLAGYATYHESFKGWFSMYRHGNREIQSVEGLDFKESLYTLYEYDEDKVTSVEGNTLKGGISFLRNVCPSELKALREGVPVLDEIAYVEYVEEKEK